jgi:hypothetical protein
MIGYIGVSAAPIVGRMEFLSLHQLAVTASWGWRQRSRSLDTSYAGGRPRTSYNGEVPYS